MNVLFNWLLTAEMSPAGTTEQTESSVQSDGGELRVLMSLMKPEIILVEDAAELKTEALMMTVNHPDCLLMMFLRLVILRQRLNTLLFHLS